MLDAGWRWIGWMLGSLLRIELDDSSGLHAV